MTVFRLTLTTIAFAAVYLSIAPIAPLAYNYHPLDIGSQWTYDAPGGGDQFMTIIGDRVVLGVTTRIRRQQEATQAWENYWTSDETGSLYLHGAYNYDSFGVAYLPPIEMVSAPLFEGKAWVTEDIHIYYLDGTPWGDEPFDYPLRVYSEGMVSVPAGEFYTYGVGYDISPPFVLSHGGKSYDLLGRRIESGVAGIEDHTSHWYTDGVGLVMFGYIVGVQYELRSYDFPVKTIKTTWGRIRALYLPEE